MTLRVGNLFIYVFWYEKRRTDNNFGAISGFLLALLQFWELPPNLNWEILLTKYESEMKAKINKITAVEFILNTQLHRPLFLVKNIYLDTIWYSIVLSVFMLFSIFRYSD